MKTYWFTISILLGLLPQLGLSAEDWGELSSYRRGNMAWLGTYGGVVEVNPRSDLVAARHGEIRWLVEDQAEVSEGDAIAYYDAVKVDQSQGQLDLLEGAQDVKLRELRWAHEEKVRGLERQHAQLASEISQIKLSKEEERLVGKELAARLEEERRKSEVDLERLKEKLEPEFLAKQLKIQEQELEHELVTARHVHKTLQKIHSVVADHDGIVHQHKTGEVRARAIVGELEERGVALAKLRVLDPQIRAEPQQDLKVSIIGPKGNRFEGSFSHKIGGELEGVGPEVYCFNLENTEGGALDSELTGKCLLSVYRKLEGEAHIIKKTRMLFAEPEKIQELGWARYIKGIWPEARIIHIGPNTIAIAAD